MQGLLKGAATQLTTASFKLAALSPQAPPAPFCNYSMLVHSTVEKETIAHLLKINPQLSDPKLKKIFFNSTYMLDQKVVPMEVTISLMHLQGECTAREGGIGITHFKVRSTCSGSLGSLVLTSARAMRQQQSFLSTKLSTDLKRETR